MWNKSPERYKREYFEKGRRLDTEALRFGKGFADSVENGTYKESTPDLIVCDEVEYKLYEDILGVTCLSYVDTYETATNTFREYKTGRVPWTQSKVQKHGQLLFYALMLRVKTGKMPTHCYLDWIETAHSSTQDDDFWAKADKHLNITGKIVSFKREFDPRELDRLEKEILKTAEEISEAYHQFISEL